MTVRELRPDKDTTVGLLMGAVQRLTNEVTGMRTEVREVKANQEDMREQITAVGRQNRDFYRSELGPIKERLQILEGDYEDISGVFNPDDPSIASVRELERSARTHRARAAAEELQRKRLQRWGAAAAPVLVGLGAGLWQLFKAVVLKQP